MEILLLGSPQGFVAKTNTADSLHTLMTEIGVTD